MYIQGKITSRLEQLNTRRERDAQNAQRLLELQFWGVPSGEHGKAEVARQLQDQVQGHGNQEVTGDWVQGILLEATIMLGL